jgi:serine/threonine protein kinase
LANGDAFLVHNETGSTLVLKVGSERYVKFRNIAITDDPQKELDDEWIQVGGSSSLFLSKTDFVCHVSEHDDPKYGQYSDIKNAAKNFIQNASAPVRKVATLQSPLKEAKLAVEMDDKGSFRIVKREELTSGGMKKVRKEIVNNQGVFSQTFARAKVKWKQFSESVEDLTWLKNEITITQKLHRLGVPNIVVVSAGKGQNINKARVEMPFLEEGDFEKIVRNGVGSSAPEVRKERLSYMLQIAQALCAMHKCGYVHNDIKLDNFLKDRKRALLSDFGLSSQVGVMSFAGAFPAPECVHDNPKDFWVGSATRENDCWAFGIALFSMLHGQKTFLGKKWLEHVNAARCTQGRKSVEATALSISHYLLHSKDPADQLIRNLLSNKPEQRPTMKDVVERLEKMVG